MSEHLVATASQTVGPFFHFGLTTIPRDRMVDHFSTGDPIRLTIRVTDGDSVPVADAMLELCQDGVFGRMPTGEDGCCGFDTVHPSSLQPRHKEPGAAHISVCVFARGLLRQLHTRIYFEGDPGLEHDRVLRLVPADRRTTLLAVRDDSTTPNWRFELRLQGPGETVFFNV